MDRVLKLFYCTTFLHFGAGKVVVDLALEAKKRGHEPLIAATAKFENFESQPHLIEQAKKGGVEVLLFKDLYTRNTQDNFDELFKKRPFDLIHSHAAVPGALAKKAYPQISTVHAWGPKKELWMRQQDVAFLNGVEIVHAVSEDVKEYLIKEGVSRPIEMVYNGVDFSRLPEKKAHPGKIIGTTAHLEERKGITYLIEAVRQLQGDFEVWILGDGPDRAKLEEQAKGLPIKFFGFVPDPYPLMAEFDLFVLPSLSEGLPVSLVEAMYMKIPIVTTTAQGNREVGGDGRAHLVPPGDAAALAAAIQNPSTDLDQAKKWVETHFDQKKCYDRLFALYQKLL